MTKRSLYVVILAGGRGERFWPLSTRRRPKQLLPLFDGQPLVCAVAARLSKLVRPSNTFLITTAGLEKIVRRVLPKLPADHIVGEPRGRDTAAACALGLALVQARDPDGTICVIPADQWIDNDAKYIQALRSAIMVAEHQDVLVTIGIRPDVPSTGYGYIETRGHGRRVNGNTVLDVRRFVEKPTLPVARRYTKTGRHFWNGGMFIWSVQAFQKALGVHAPDMYAFSQQLAAATRSPRWRSELASRYATVRKISIDYALLEKASNIRMVVAPFGWDDVGSWSALERHFRTDRQNNVRIGMCEAMDSSRNLVVSESRLTALIGVHDMVVVHAAGATLVCHRDHVQAVKKMVQQLAKKPSYRHLL